MPFGSFLSQAWEAASETARDAVNAAAESVASVAKASAELTKAVALATADAAEATVDAAVMAARATAEAVEEAAVTTGEAVIAAANATADAAEATVDAAVMAARATAEAVEEAAVTTGEAVVAAANATAQAGATVARKVAAVGLLGSEAAVAGAGYAVAKVSSAIQTSGGSKVASAFEGLKEKFFPRKMVEAPCVACLSSDRGEARKARILRRNELIDKASMGTDPVAMAKARELKDDMKAVEMARLANDAYNYKAPKPPEPWEPMSDAKLVENGISPKLLTRAKAVVYQLPAWFPGGPKTVLAFQGTNTPEEGEDPRDTDFVTDHDNAMGMETKQYSAAKILGTQVAAAFPEAEVTGHSLGGGKAQCAGVAGGLNGMMFNSAGLHPGSVEGADLEKYESSFLQYRAGGGAFDSLGGDPLTGLQNSPATQAAVYKTVAANAWAANELGLDKMASSIENPLVNTLAGRILHVTPEAGAANKDKYGWYVPPAVGEVREVRSLTNDGVSPGRDPGGQHSMDNLINGFEQRKFDDISLMLKSTGSTDDPKTYLGPVMQRLQ